MRKITVVLVVLAALIIATVVGATSTQITLLHVSDTDSHLAPFGPKDAALNAKMGGLTKAASVIVAEKAKNPAALFVHGGDFMHGDFFFNEYLSVPELQLLQSIGLDVLAVGNHEFRFGPDLFAGVLDATWPGGAGSVSIVGTNLDLSGYPVLGAWIEPTIVKDASGVKVGFFGLTTPYDLLELPDPVEISQDFNGIATESVEALRGMGAQVVICLSHLGLDLSRQLAEAVPGIDVIVNAHDHVALHQPEQIASPGGRTTLVVSAGAYYRWVGRLELAVDGSDVKFVGYQLIDVDKNVAEQPDVAAVVGALEDGIVARYGDVYHQRLAWAFGTIPNKGDPSDRARDTAVGNLWTDAYRKRTGTDIAIEVNGYLDAPIPPGRVVGADLFRVNSGGLPAFDLDTGKVRVPPFHLVTMHLRGDQLVQALEIMLTIGQDAFFPQVSGMSFDYDSSQPPLQQVILKSIRVGKRRLETGHFYSLTVNEEVNLFLPLLGIPVSDVDVRPDVGFEAVRDLVKARGFLFPWPEGRIRDVGVSHHH